MIVKGLGNVIDAYNRTDRLLTTLGAFLIILMLLKLILFPYGLFSFGDKSIYTEGLVSRAGIQNINPLFVDYNEADRDISRLVFSGLMKYDPKTGQIVDDIATLTINEEKTEYTLTVKDNIFWHDGQPLTAADAYFTFKDIVGNQYFPNEILKTNFNGVKIELIDSKNIKFTLEKPNVFFLSNLTVGLLPQHILKDLDPAEIIQHEFNKLPIGSGPYQVTEPAERFLDGRWQITLERFDDYYGGRSGIEFMRFIVYETADQLLRDVNTMDGIVKISGEYLIDFEEIERFSLIPYRQPQYMAVFMNLDSQILKENAGIRLAIQQAIDKDALIGERVDIERVDTPFMELNQDEWRTEASVEKAEKSLSDAGFTYKAEDTERAGIRYNEDGDGLELRMIARAYPEGSAEMNSVYKTTDYLIAALELVGFEIDIQYLNLPEFTTAASSRQYDLLLIGQNLGYNSDAYSYWHTTQANPRGQNFANYGKFQVDTIIERLRETFDQSQKLTLLTDLAKQIKADIPAVFLYRPLYYYATDNKVQGVSMEGIVFPSDRFANVTEWRFSE